MNNARSTRPPLLTRLPVDGPRATLRFTLDGQPCTGQAGDTVMTAVLTQPGRPPRLRACTTPLHDGMALLTGPTA